MIDFINAVTTALKALLTAVVALVMVVIMASVAAAIPVALVYAIYKAFPQHIDQKTNAGWVDLIVSNQYVVFAIRIVVISLALVLLFAGVYITISILMRTWRREWLHKAGPFEAELAERAADDLGEIGDDYGQVLADAWKQNEDLSQRLSERIEELEAVSDERDRLRAELGQREGGA